MNNKGKIVTVLGQIDPESLGITMTHEHLHIYAPSFYTPPPKQYLDLIDAPFDLKNLGFIRQYCYSHKPNLIIQGEDEAIREEMFTYKENGGRSIVDVTTTGIDRNVQFLKSIAETTGVNVISGAGFYCENYQSHEVKSYSQEKMAEMIRSDLINGVDGVNCGVIGEVGCTLTLSEFEKRSLKSAAAVQEELGCPLIIHPGRNSKAPPEIMRLIAEAGGNPRQTVMSHLDRTFLDSASLLEFAEFGTFLEYDLFGMETSSYQLDVKTDMPSDAQRIKLIKALMDNGFGDRALIAHDMHTKHRMTKYGGHGYSHILTTVIPKMLQRGFSQEQVDQILIHNPKQWLTWQK